jgi:diguanylate cyclase (GGDEF)-like protein
VNSRFFYGLLQIEINRLDRYGRPFTMAYIDIDDFKAVNDRYGHSVGDQVLCRLVESSQKLIRKTDVLARLGGDEFALLLPETNQEAARVAIEKMGRALSMEMERSQWPVTFSIGVLTCTGAPRTADELVKMADEAMYSVKRNLKNGIEYSSFAGYPTT